MPPTLLILLFCSSSSSSSSSGGGHPIPFSSAAPYTLSEVDFVPPLFSASITFTCNVVTSSSSSSLEIASSFSLALSLAVSASIWVDIASRECTVRHYRGKLHPTSVCRSVWPLSCLLSLLTLSGDRKVKITKANNSSSPGRFCVCVCVCVCVCDSALQHER